VPKYEDILAFEEAYVVTHKEVQLPDTAESVTFKPPDNNPDEDTRAKDDVHAL
jgi:hypothetical protein